MPARILKSGTPYLKLKRNGLPERVSAFPDRHGKRRYRYRKGAFSYYFQSSFGTPEFQQEYDYCVSGQRPEIGEAKVIPGSMKALVSLYYRSPYFLDLADTTKNTYRIIIEKFLAEHGDKPAKGIERKHIQAIMAKMSDRPQAANNLFKKLRILMRFAAEIGMREDNPCDHVRMYRKKTAGHHTWTEGEIATYEAKHPTGTKARLTFDLLLYTAQRRCDVVKMGRQHLKGSMIRVRQQKTGTYLWIPLHQALLASLPKDNMTFIVTEHGTPFSAKGFGNRFRKWCDEAGLKHCSAHGLRKAAARRLAEAGCTPHEIASITGHKSLSEIEHYTRDVNQAQIAGIAEGKLSNLRAGLDKKTK